MKATTRLATRNSFCGWLGRLVLGTATAASAVGAEAEGEKPFPPWDRGALRVGGFATVFDSTVSFGVEGSGVDLDAEDLLGLDSSLVVFRLDALYRLGASRRHQLDFSYVGFRRSAGRTLSETITIGDETVVAGTAIESYLNSDFFRASYTYSFLQNERFNLGAGLGVYIAPVGYGIDVTTPGETRTVDERDVTLPLPVFSIRGEVRLCRRFSLRGSVDGFYLELDGYSGSLFEAQVGVEYQFTKNLGMGVAYDFFNVDVNAAGEASDFPGIDFDGAVNVRTSGLLLYGKLSF